MKARLRAEEARAAEEAAVAAALAGPASGGRAARRKAKSFKETEVPSRWKPQHAQAQKIRKALRKRGAPTHYVCECTAMNLWSKIRCPVCSTRRPAPDVARVMLESRADHLEGEVARAVQRTRDRAAARRAGAGGASLGARPGAGAGAASSGSHASAPGSPATPADKPEDLSTYVVADGTVTLSKEYPCKWLDELQRSRSLTRNDLSMLTKDVVLANREAVLL